MFKIDHWSNVGLKLFFGVSEWKFTSKGVVKIFITLVSVVRCKSYS